MKKFKCICIVVLIICAILFITFPSIVYKHKITLCFIVALSLLILYIICSLEKTFANILFGIFIKTIPNKLTKNDIDSLIINNIFFNKYNHTIDGIFKVLDEIVLHAGNNFTQESIDILTANIENYNNIINNLEQYINIQKITTKKMWNIKLANMLFLCFDSKNYRKVLNISKKNNIFTVPYLIFDFCCILFLYSHEKLFFIILLPFFAGLFVLHVFVFENRVIFSTIQMAVAWFALLMSTMMAPLFLSYYVISNLLWILFHSTIFILILIGIWITNKMWTYLDIEKRNVGTFFPKYKFMEIIEAKIMRKIRYVWLWIAFFIMILSVISTYSFIYLKHLTLGSFYNCFLISLQAYFIGNGENIYFMAETIMAFIINTLYISNIVRLILEPKLKQ